MEIREPGCQQGSNRLGRSDFGTYGIILKAEL